MKKLLALALIAPLLVSCSSNKKGDTYNEAWVKDTNGFDILMGQFAHNIENIWGFNEVLIAGPKDYVKYSDGYQTRSHINFDAGTITVETIAGTDPAARLRQAIVTTLLMGDDPGSVDLYSDADDIQISKEPFLYGQVVDNTGKPIRWEGRATNAMASTSAITKRATASRPNARHWRNRRDACSVLRSSSSENTASSAGLTRRENATNNRMIAAAIRTPARAAQGHCHDNIMIATFPPDSRPSRQLPSR